PCTDPEKLLASPEEIMASPTKLSHIVLQTNRRREMVDWCCTVLGAEVLHEKRAYLLYQLRRRASSGRLHRPRAAGGTRASRRERAGRPAPRGLHLCRPR